MPFQSRRHIWINHRYFRNAIDYVLIIAKFYINKTKKMENKYMYIISSSLSHLKDILILKKRYTRTNIEIETFQIEVYGILIISPDESRGYIGFRSVAPPPP